MCLLSYGLRILSTSGGPFGAKPQIATRTKDRRAERADRITLQKRPETAFEIPLNTQQKGASHDTGRFDARAPTQTR